MDIDQKTIVQIGNILNNKDLPLKQRFRALFTLKNIGGKSCIEEISKCFKDESALLKHELAYCLGQMQDEYALPILISVLADVQQEAMVRHEAAEALGAIGSVPVKSILEQYKNDSCVEVRETCEIALDRLNFANSNDNLENKNPFNSVDPSPPAESNNLDQLKQIYLNENESLFNRYRALFSLRNMKNTDSALAISEGLNDKRSALFRHEVAFVLGQLQEPCSIPYLIKNLEDKAENMMVRHECAEALGAIATQECTDILTEYLKDNERVVKESCEVALDMCEYENSCDFQYANTLKEIKV